MASRCQEGWLEMPTRMALGVPVALAVSRFRFSSLRRARPHVFGLATSQAPAPAMLSEDGWNHGKLTEVALSYGQVLDVTALLIEVTTDLDGQDGLPSLAALVARREREDAAIVHANWEEVTGSIDDRDEEAASRLAVSNERMDVLINGERETVSLICYRHYQALRFRHDSLTIRVVSRHSLPELPRFEIVTDLEPYFRGYTKFMRSLLKWAPADAAGQSALASAAPMRRSWAVAPPRANSPSLAAVK